VATRRERVILDLEDNFTSGVARAAVAAGLLKRELNDLSGHSVRTSRDLDRQSKSVDKLGQSSRRAGPDIDKFSGRLRTLADAALILGPALIPIGAATIPVLTAALAGLGAAAGGIGAAVLAFKGLGDGIKAIDAYQLEPTAENLSKMRIELEKLGPAGAEFAHYIDDLEPTLRDLQNIARTGLFPGVEDGIDGLLTRLPQLRRIVAELSTGMGHLARDAGEALGGPKFDAFFAYIESDAKPTLQEFGRATGYVAEGIANMLVAFAPLSRDFTGGLEDATKAFAKWSRGLDQNQGFQDFLDYVRESGPQVVDLLAALATALGGLLHAAAPLGRVVVPALTAIARAFAAIADSPIGPPLYTAVAAMVAFNRVSALTTRSVTSLQTGFRKLSVEADSTKGRLSGLLGRGGVVFAGAAAVAMLADNINRIDPTNLERSLEALKFGDVTPTVDKVIDSIQQLESNWNKVDLGEVVTAGGLLGDSSLDKFANNIDQVDQSLASMVESGNVDEAATLFAKLQALASDRGIDPSAVTDRFDAYAQALHNVAEATYRATGASNPFSGALRLLGNRLGEAKHQAADLSGALSNLNGWFDKREAVRNYRDSIDTLSKSLKNGFKQKDAENLDDIGRNILQVASTIKDKGLQQDFLAGARASLVKLADGAGPKAEAAIQRVITKLDSEGLTHPPAIPLKVDDKATPTLDDLGIKLRRYGDTKATAKADIDPGNSFSILDAIKARLGGLHDRTISVTTISHSVRGGATPRGEYRSGGFTGFGDPRRPAGVVHGREVVIPERYAMRDLDFLRRRYPDLPGFADGGLAGRTYTSRRGNGSDDAWHAMTGEVWHVVDGLKGLKAQLAATQKAYDKAKSARDQAVSNRDNLSSSIQQSLMGDSIFAASGSVWASGSTAANTPQGAIAALNARKDRANRFVAAVNTLKGKGVTGAALQAILSEGLEAAEAMAAADSATLSSFSTAENESSQALAAAGLAGGNAVFGDDVRTTQKHLDRLHHDLQEVKQAVHQAEKANDRAHDRSAMAVKDGVNGAASAGHRHGRGGRR
jgi:hypothetical protein